MTDIKKIFLPVLVILLFVIILLQRCNNNPGKIIPGPDTTIVYDTIVVHDTVRGKIVYIHSKPDVLWKTDTAYRPDTNYNGLLKQYTKLGDDYFSLRTFKTEFSVDPYGTVTVTDEIKTNELINTTMISNLKIPEKTITITKYSEPKRQLYAGVELFGNPTSLLTGAQANMLYKDKKDRIFGAGVGWNGEIQYSVSSYWKIKLNNR